MSYPHRRLWSRLLPALLLLLLPSCRDRVVGPELTPEPAGGTGMVPVGVVEVTITVDGDNVSTTTRSLGVGGPSLDLKNPTNAPPGGDGSIQLESVSSGSFTEGARNADGQRYFVSTLRIRNATSAGTPYNTARQNLTFLGARTPSSISGTAFSQVRKFDLTAASPTLAPLVTPTGAVILDDSAKMTTSIPDVLQIITEAEAAAAQLPAGVNEVFPWGFVVRNPNTPNSRNLPANPAPNQWDGLLTLAFRVPLQATAALDVYSVTFALVAVDDSETRVTESIEEQDTASSNRLRARATALGATVTTVLNGSPAADPFITDYPGQRQICSPRVSGVSGSPTRTINGPGAYVRIGQYYSGESVDACAPFFRSGTPARPALTVDFPVTLRAMDRYGNVKTAAVDTVSISSTVGGFTMLGPPTALVSGAATLNVRYDSYGNGLNIARGRRNTGGHLVSVSGTTRTWTGNTNTSWQTGTNWNPVGGTPGVQDTAVIPGDRPNYPLLTQNTAIAGLTMVSGASVQPFVNVSSFDFTANADVLLGTTGTFTGTGRLILAGISNSVGGGLSNFDIRNMRVTGRYSATSNLNVTGGRIVVQGGRLRTTGFRIRVRPS